MSVNRQEYVKLELPGVHDRKDVVVDEEVRVLFESAVAVKKTADGWSLADVKAALERNIYGGYKSIYYDGAWWVWRLLNGLIPAGEPEDELDDLI